MVFVWHLLHFSAALILVAWRDLVTVIQLLHLTKVNISFKKLNLIPQADRLATHLLIFS